MESSCKFFLEILILNFYSKSPKENVINGWYIKTIGEYDYMEVDDLTKPQIFELWTFYEVRLRGLDVKYCDNLKFLFQVNIISTIN